MKNYLKRIISVSLVFALAVVAGSALLSADPVDAEGDNVTITLSDSAPEATGVTYTALIEFGDPVTINGDGDTRQLRLRFDEIYDGSSGLLGDASIASETPEDLNCSVDAANGRVDCTPSDGTNFTDIEEIEIVIEGVENPEKDSESEVGEADTYNIRTTMPEVWGDGFIDAMYAIVEPIEVTAEVEAILEFQIYGVHGDTGGNLDSEGGAIDGPSTDHGWGTVVNGANLDGGLVTHPDEINFGVLDLGVMHTVAQDLRVVTNASEGFTVTVFQDQDLTSLQGDTINPFGEWDDTENLLERYEPNQADVWTSPFADLDYPDSWSYFGFTSQDRSLEYDEGYQCGSEYTEGTDNSYFSRSEVIAEEDLENVWAGFDGSTPEAVMCHVGPSDGETENVGMTRVGYSIEISPLQPAGQYTNTLTYIATPTF